MNISPLSLPDVLLVTPEVKTDSRGSFIRTYCQEAFSKLGLRPSTAQCNVSYNTQAGTLRGLHFQTRPHQEAKLIRCQRGASFHVAVDLRKESATFCEWVTAELSAESYKSLYVPEGFAHGFITLKPATEVFYQMSSPYAPESANGFRWNDPAFDIRWPVSVQVISEKDATYPDFSSSCDPLQA